MPQIEKNSFFVWTPRQRERERERERERQKNTVFIE